MALIGVAFRQPLICAGRRGHGERGAGERAGRGAGLGCGGLKRTDKTTGEIKRVWTAPSARGMGVARRMLGTLEAAARNMGLRTLRLDTNRALTEAHALYRKEGFREIARFNDNPYADHWFEKQL